MNCPVAKMMTYHNVNGTDSNMKVKVTARTVTVILRTSASVLFMTAFVTVAENEK